MKIMLIFIIEEKKTSIDCLNFLLFQFTHLTFYRVIKKRKLRLITFNYKLTRAIKRHETLNSGRVNKKKKQNKKGSAIICAISKCS